MDVLLLLTLVTIVMDLVQRLLPLPELARSFLSRGSDDLCTCQP